jgi:hypothetical protein
LNPSAPFVRFNDGSVNEYLQSGSTWLAVNVCSSGASEISASQNQADDVFVRFGGNVKEHIGTNPDNTFGWTMVAEEPPYHAATEISAGYNATTGSEAVFINFNGLGLEEHTGSDYSTNWTPIASNVASFSASQIQRDTVFIVDTSGKLSEYASGVVTPIMGNVAQVSAGVDSSGHAAAFILSNHNLYEHTGVNPRTGWTYIDIRGDVYSIDAAQASSDTVFYTRPSYNDLAIWNVWEHHHGQSDTIDTLDTLVTSI